MLLLTAAATAETYVNLGYPCSRLNWAWRNLWSTCSINSYVPTEATTHDVVPAFWRKYPVNVGNNEDFGAPTNILDAPSGIMSPNLPSAGTELGQPLLLCAALADGTGGTGPYKSLRNRCRRALDAYGGLVRLCSLADDVLVPGQHRGPVAVPDGNVVYPNWLPAADAHTPHVNNMKALYAHARYCTEKDAPGTFKSPSTTCPGLLGWFTVVWHACSFETMGPTIGTQALTRTEIAPLGEAVHPAIFWTDASPIQDSPQMDGSPTFVFCNPLTTNVGTDASAPNTWFARPPALDTVNRPFRTTRCRKALDQLGRTAARCGLSNAFQATIAEPWVGAKDQLLSFLQGGAAGTFPMGFLNLAPLCN